MISTPTAKLPNLILCEIFRVYGIVKLLKWVHMVMLLIGQRVYDTCKLWVYKYGFSFALLFVALILNTAVNYAIIYILIILEPFSCILAWSRKSDQVVHWIMQPGRNRIYKVLDSMKFWYKEKYCTRYLKLMSDDRIHTFLSVLLVNVLNKNISQESWSAACIQWLVFIV